ncbi:hypothetical protein TRFO_41250 [Tritrichomonas foetus]|uniref:Uncharacterized protein n=1 Tax=Tritrichomonas foetus TaxID=1144522 RepID=A0A1J4L0Y0_9EUKA|nr:hypothetical protein TRFO_41250 [Tritrichomonas foetus]|eukprot:OHT17177.1 hypothetical protein TRFO_41250 [Tritrichomonas foetus]
MRRSLNGCRKEHPFDSGKPYLIMYPPVSDSLTRFLDAVPLYSPDCQKHLSKMLAQRQKVQNMIVSLTNKLNQINILLQTALDTFANFNRYDHQLFTHEVCFVVNKFMKIFLKYQHLRYDHFTKIIEAMTELDKIINLSIQQNAPLIIEFWDFATHSFNNFDPEMPKLSFKLKSLFNYIKNAGNVLRTPEVPLNKMVDLMRVLSDDVDSKSGFIQSNKFDIIFEEFIEYNNLSPIFDQILGFRPFIPNKSPKSYLPSSSINDDSSNNTKSCIVNSKSEISGNILNHLEIITNYLEKRAKRPITENDFHFHVSSTNITNCNGNNRGTKNHNSQNNQKINIKYFESYVKYLYMKITSTEKANAKMFTVFRCAAIRFLSQRYFLYHQIERLNGPSEKFLFNCGKILHHSPRELNISPNIIPNNYYDIPFETIIEDKIFRKIMSNIFSTQFIISPIDIWYEISKSIRLIVHLINSLTNIDDDHSKISFDDFFTILLPFYAKSQVLCPQEMNAFLTQFMGLRKSNGLEFAATSILALYRIVAFNG